METSSEAPCNTTAFAADIRVWNTEQVRSWVSFVVDKNTADIIAEELIDGIILLTLSETDLKALGVKMGPARHLCMHLAVLKANGQHCRIEAANMNTDGTPTAPTRAALQTHTAHPPQRGSENGPVKKRIPRFTSPAPDTPRRAKRTRVLGPSLSEHEATIRASVSEKELTKRRENQLLRTAKSNAALGSRGRPNKEECVGEMVACHLLPSPSHYLAVQGASHAGSSAQHRNPEAMDK